MGKLIINIAEERREWEMGGKVLHFLNLDLSSFHSGNNSESACARFLP